MLGAATMRSVGAQPGGLVQVTVTDPQGAPHKAQFRVVGRASFPPGFGTGGLGSGAAMTSSALTDTQCPPGAGRHACQRNVQRGTIYSLLARAAPGRPRLRRWPGTSADTVSSQASGPGAGRAGQLR